ncbi:MAG: glycosyl transferase family 1 [Clostridium cadaveris]|uniref:Glycosyl transferase family 1 n=1 Tax=Clostridium cadaveris TaxID=1529 RepID=A0A316MFI7_9CLOT|nr:MAG: glycosyl transferase family 1 [Clostridium cadaveris]
MDISYLLSKLIKKIHIPSIKKSNIDKTAKVCSGSHLVEVNIGKYSYVGNFCTIINTNIGKFCSIADNCIIGGASHPIKWVSTSPVFHEGKNIMKKNFSNHPYETFVQTTIGNDVWIGNNCLIKSGLTIEDGAVIGMGSVLTKDVGAYEVWAGNPAKLIKKRFDNEIIEKLLIDKWWDNEDIVLEQKSKNFNNVNKFVEEI